MSSVTEEILSEVERLSPETQLRVLDFIRSVAGQRTIQPQQGSRIAHLAGSISKEDLDIMRQVADVECEKIDPDAW